MARLARTFVVLVAIQVATAVGLVAGEHCAPRISCTLDSGPCEGKLVGEVVVDLTDITIELYDGIFTYWLSLDYCRFRCAYEVTDSSGEVYHVEMTDQDCSGDD